MRRPDRIVPGPGQESVWDYPRPPHCEPTTSQIEVVYNKVVIASTVSAYRVLETSHSPVYYIPPSDIVTGALRPSGRRPSFCEFKGLATYFNVVVDDFVERDAAWAYPVPSASYAELADHVAFYPARMDGCYVDGELAQPQPGGFYGGWITSKVVGPFKGGPGSHNW